MSDLGVWGVAIERLDDAGRGEVEVVEFTRFADLVPFVRSAYERADVAVSSVFDLESGYEVEVQLTSHDGKPPCVTIFPRRGGRWRAVYPDETSDVQPSFEAVAA